MTDTLNLLPCPFCGSPGEIVAPKTEQGERYWYVGCTNSHCPLDVGSCPCDTESESLQVWNNRAPVSPSEILGNADFPMGAIENGRVHIERLQDQCTAFDIENVRSCFEYMAAYLMAHQPKREIVEDVRPLTDAELVEYAGYMAWFRPEAAESFKKQRPEVWAKIKHFFKEEI